MLSEMKILNKTEFREMDEILRSYVENYNLENLIVKISYMRKGAKSPYSGICYYKKNKIRVSINKNNKYPIKIKVGSPFNTASWEYYYLNSPEEVILFVFLHEISHYLDYINGLAMGCKETKADKFALWMMNKLREKEI